VDQLADARSVADDDVIDAYAPHGRLVLAGHSIGGMTVMELALQRPELAPEFRTYLQNLDI
jgi:pimeloyl-ACP methyl ester carboxylesterase